MAEESEKAKHGGWRPGAGRKKKVVEAAPEAAPEIVMPRPVEAATPESMPTPVKIAEPVMEPEPQAEQTKQQFMVKVRNPGDNPYQLLLCRSRTSNEKSYAPAVVVEKQQPQRYWPWKHF